MTCLPRSNDGLPLRLTNGQLARDHSCCTAAIRYARCGDTAQYIYVSASLSMGSKIVYSGKCWTIYDGPYQPAPAGTITDPLLVATDWDDRCCYCAVCGDGRAIDGLNISVAFSGLTILTQDCAYCGPGERTYMRLADGVAPVQINGLSLSKTITCSQSIAEWADALPVYFLPTGSIEYHWTDIVEANGGCSTESLDDTVLPSASRYVSVSVVQLGGGITRVAVAAGSDRVFYGVTELPTEDLCDGLVNVEVYNERTECIDTHALWAWGGKATVTIQIDEGI